MMGEKNRQNSKVLRAKYINSRLMGKTTLNAAKEAGYKDPHSAARNLMLNGTEQMVEEKLEELSRETLYTRDKVMEIVEEAVEIAKLAADPMAMIRGAQEFNKMQGYYAPETKRLELDVDHNIRVQQIQNMSEADLLAQLGEEEAYIDAEFSELPDEE